MTDADGRPRRASGLRGLNATARYAIALGVIYLVLRWGVGYLTQMVTGATNPQPVPSRLLTTYLLLALMALAVQIATSDGELHAFWDPIATLLGGRAADGRTRALRLALVALPPLLVGGFVYDQLVPKIASGATSRQQHPALPEAYLALENPYRAQGPAEQEAAIREGIVLYETNCRPCHGTAADGQGPMAAAFRPRPIAFTDAGTIDTIVESYPLWRIEKGGLGLPAAATPWDSAMPPWEGELTQDEMWKIIMAEYDISGKEPRLPEKLQ